MVNSKQRILTKLRSQVVPHADLPEVLSGNWLRYEDPLKKYSESLKFVGGTCEELSSLAELREKLNQFEQFRDAKRIFSRVSQIEGNVDFADIADPHDLENVDFVIYPAEFAVAENGAVWLTDNNLRHRVIFFITQYLVLIVRRSDIVHNMHEAYARAVVPQPGFGLFLSGPSKTADIEQSLVIGAHGCKELQVYVVP